MVSFSQCWTMITHSKKRAAAQERLEKGEQLGKITLNID